MSITPLDVAKRQTGAPEPVVNQIDIPVDVQQRILHPQATQLAAIRRTLQAKVDSQFVRRQQVTSDKENLQLWIIPGKHLVISRENLFRSLQPGTLSDNELELVHEALARIR